MRSAAPTLAADQVHVHRVVLASGSREEARRALRDLLGAYLNASPEAIPIVAGPRGKPELADRSLRFNLSHSGDLALVAVARHRGVGVDVERIDSRRDVLALAGRALEAEAAAAVRTVPASDRAAAFHRAWARREAAVKCAGTGLGVPAPDGARRVIDLDVGEGYAAALAVEGSGPVNVETS